MKRKMLLMLLSLSCVMQLATAKNNKKLFKRNDFVVQSALLRKDEKQSRSSKCCDNSGLGDSVCCQRGKRGHRGPRGPQGRGGGPNELFLNAFMMNWLRIGGEPSTPAFPPNANFSPYGPDSTMGAWALVNSTSEFSSTDPIGMNVNVPIDLDRTKPVTAVVHLLVNSDPDFTGDQVAIEVAIDYQPEGGLIGNTFPATGFKEFVTSPDFSITTAVPFSSTNLRQISVSLPLDQALINGEWAFMTVGRVAPASNEYSNDIYLSSISVQYTRIES